MARSTYIYAVYRAHGNVAAFTVKHELVSYLQRKKALDNSHVGLRVERLPDGRELRTTDREGGGWDHEFYPLDVEGLINGTV
jgi:hypothetical protein